MNLKGFNKMRKQAYCIFLTILLVISTSYSTSAHDREEHDADLEYVLFGSREYKQTHPAKAHIIQAIEDAAYLCVDQFNGNGTKELLNLKNENIPGIPNDISEIDFSSNYSHRSNTHRGWNVQYSEKSHWPKRQEILLNTVETMFFSDSTPLDWLPFVSDILGVSDDNKKKIESMSILIYYVHIIGDHLEATKFEALSYVAPLTNLNDRDNPGVIPDLITYLGILFEDQKGTYTFIDMMQELEYIQDRSDALTSSIGGVNTVEEFDDYHQCAIDLLDALGTYVPILLRNEEFFYEAMFAKDAA